MADLDVQPKNSTPAWLWPLVALIALGLLFYLVKGCNHTNTTVVTTDSTKTVTDTTRAVAVTQPDWDNVDFNSPNSADPDITDKDIVVRSNDKYTIYTLGENILFATDQNTLQGNAGEKLKMITTAINKRFKGASIGVYGNTDATGSASHNKQLDGIIGRHGFDPRIGAHAGRNQTGGNKRHTGRPPAKPQRGDRGLPVKHHALIINRTNKLKMLKRWL
jgi:hypothetical protein